MWTYQDNHYYKTLMNPMDYQVCVEDQVWNMGCIDLLKGRKNICGYYIVDGTLTLYDQVFEKDTLLWIDAGETMRVQACSSVHLIMIETKQQRSYDGLHYQTYEDSKLSWSKALTDGMTASKHMIKAEDYGVKIQTCIYTRDFTHAWHTHSAAHGFYVLEGMLQYDFQDGRKGLYGPGEFIASQPGDEILHVQAPHASHCKYLFIGDGPFDFIVNGENLYGK